MKIRHNLYTAVFLIVLIASLPLASANTLSYDANGNLVSGDGKYRIYDGFNHLVQVRNGDNATAPILENYTWHPMEDKILAKSVYETNGSWKEDVLYISKEYIVVDNASGSFDYKYYYQNGQLVAFENYDGKKFFVLGDHKGSVSVITNESGAKVEETFYEPFGKVISGGAVSRFSYEGKELSSVLGDYDFHARKYDPDLKVLTQPDMNIPDVYNPQDLNRYTFERNNPAKYEDKDGKIAELIEAIGIGSIGSYAIMAHVYSKMAENAPNADMAKEFTTKSAASLEQAKRGIIITAGTESLGKSSLAGKLKIAEGTISALQYVNYYDEYQADLDRFSFAKYGKEWKELSDEEMSEVLDPKWLKDMKSDVKMDKQSNAITGNSIRTTSNAGGQISSSKLISSMQKFYSMIRSYIITRPNKTQIRRTVYPDGSWRDEPIK